MDGSVDIGILKYRSMIARISVAYAELAPEVKITLSCQLISLSPQHPSLPDEDGLFDTELPGIQLKSK